MWKLGNPGNGKTVYSSEICRENNARWTGVEVNTVFCVWQRITVLCLAEDKNSGKVKERWRGVELEHATHSLPQWMALVFGRTNKI